MPRLKCLVLFFAVLFSLCSLLAVQAGDEGQYKVPTGADDPRVVSGVNAWLQEYLRDPESYRPIRWSVVINMPGGSGSGTRYIVTHKFRSKNGFGGYAVDELIFFLNKDHQVIDVIPAPPTKRR